MHHLKFGLRCFKGISRAWLRRINRAWLYKETKVKRIVLDLESEVHERPRFYSQGGNIFSKFYNPNLHNIARSDSLGFKTKNPITQHSLVHSMGPHINRNYAVKFVLSIYIKRGNGKDEAQVKIHYLCENFNIVHFIKMSGQFLFWV